MLPFRKNVLPVEQVLSSALVGEGNTSIPVETCAVIGNGPDGSRSTAKPTTLNPHTTCLYSLPYDMKPI